MEMDALPCPSCGSKRTTEITPTAGRPSAVWCHACGTIAETTLKQPAETISTQELNALWQRR